MIQENVKKVFNSLPSGVQVVAATKSRSVGEIEQAIKAGIKIVGENYIQEAEEKFELIGGAVKWHFIGHLQSNKVKRAVEFFDMIETVDSFKIAEELNKACQLKNRVMPILIEVNYAREKQKFGVLPEDVESLIKQIHQLRNVKIEGLMTMGPFSEKPEELRPLFKETYQLFHKLKSLNLPKVEMKYLSMGMSDSYKIAVEERANLVRIGTAIFGKRE